MTNTIPVQPFSKRLRILAATLPLLALTGDLLAILQRESVWSYGAALALGLGGLALLWDLKARTQRVAALVAGVCIAASLAVRAFAQVPFELQMALGASLAAAAVAVLLLSGALVDGLVSPDRALRATLRPQPKPKQPSAPTESGQMRPAA